MPVQIGRFIKVKAVIDRACQNGCEIRHGKSQVVTPDGTYRVRFLYNPTTGGRFDISDYLDDEFMQDSELANCERRLNVDMSGL